MYRHGVISKAVPQTSKQLVELPPRTVAPKMFPLPSRGSGPT